jgi:hypothetical protein
MIITDLRPEGRIHELLDTICRRPEATTVVVIGLILLVVVSVVPEHGRGRRRRVVVRDGRLLGRVEEERVVQLNIQGTFGEHSGNIRGTFSANGCGRRRQVVVRDG